MPPNSFSGEQQARIPPAQTAADMGAKQLVLNRERKGRGEERGERKAVKAAALHLKQVPVPTGTTNSWFSGLINFLLLLFSCTSKVPGLMIFRARLAASLYHYPFCCLTAVLLSNKFYFLSQREPNKRDHMPSKQTTSTSSVVFILVFFLRLMPSGLHWTYAIKL